ncbi:MAG TPA: hypothetical protein VEV39_16015 [Gemmatimonadales bacterium]|nr:hypothetical protein [Gemmatimonadales bacterium]
MSIPRALRGITAIGVLAVLPSCEHTQPFSSAAYQTGAPLNPGNPTQLTFSPGVDTRATWLPDGSAFLYTQEQTGSADADRCLVQMPKTGGQTTRLICESGDIGHDTLNDLESAAVNAATRMVYVRTSMRAHIGEAGPDNAGLMLATLGTPVPGSTLHALPYPSPSGQGVDMASDISWVGPSALVYLGEEVSYPSVCPGCAAVDTVRAGVEIDRIDVNGAITVVVDTGFPSSASVAGGDTLYYTLTNSGAIHRRILSTSADTVLFDYGLPATDVSAGGGRLVVVVSGLTLHLFTPATATDQTLLSPPSAVGIAHPAIDPTGHRIVADVTEFNSSPNLWLWTVP